MVSLVSSCWDGLPMAVGELPRFFEHLHSPVFVSCISCRTLRIRLYTLYENACIERTCPPLSGDIRLEIEADCDPPVDMPDMIYSGYDLLRLLNSKEAR